MTNNIKEYIGNIGSLLSQLGNELQRQVQSNQSLNIHCQVKQTMDKLTFYLHNLNADLYKNRRTTLENLEDIEIESISCTVKHLFHPKTDDVDSGRELEFTEELRKLEWLCEELQNTPDVLRYSKATYNDFSFDKISGNR